MNKRLQQPALDSDLAPWEADLARRLSSLQRLPTPPSLTNEAAEGFIARLRVQPVKPVNLLRQRTPPMLRLGTRFAAILLACLLGLSGVSYATATSLPGEPLYGLKRQVETAQLAVSSPDQRAAFTEMLLDRRLKEMTQLISQHAPETQVDAGVAEYAAAAVAFGQMSTISNKALLFQQHLTELAALESVAPDQTRAALKVAQQAAQAQLTNQQHTAPASTREAPGEPPSQTPTSSPTDRPSATTASTQPTAFRPSVNETTAQSSGQAIVSPTPTIETLPSATPLAATAVPEATRRRASPAITPTAFAKPAPVRRASPQPTPDSSPPPRPSAASSETQQPADDNRQVPPTPQSPGDGQKQAPPTPEQTNEPRNPAAPPAQGTPVPRSEQPSNIPETTHEPSNGHQPPSAPTPDKPQATSVKSGSGGSQQSPPGSGGTHPQPPGQHRKP